MVFILQRRGNVHGRFLELSEYGLWNLFFISTTAIGINYTPVAINVPKRIPYLSFLFMF
jgi:hypothetical protein